MRAHVMTDAAFKARLRAATRSPKIPHTHRTVGKLPLTYDLPIPGHTKAGIFGLGADGVPLPRVRRVDLTRNRVAVPVTRLPNTKLRNAKPWQTRISHVPATRKVQAAPGAFFPGMGELGIFNPSPYGRLAPGTRWMNKHGHRMYQVDGLGAFSARKLHVKPPRILGGPRTTKVGLVPAMGRARNFIPGLGEEDAGDTLEAGYLSAQALAADEAPSSPAPAAQAIAAGTHAMGTMLAVAAGAFLLGAWLRSR